MINGDRMFLCWGGNKLNHKFDVFADLEIRSGSFLSKHTCVRTKSEDLEAII